MASSRFVDCYKTLLVSPNASSSQIKSAFFKLAKSCHPDVAKTGSDTKFKQINDAYQTLSRDRSAYDSEYKQHYGHNNKHSTPASFSSPPESPFNTFHDPVSSFSAFQWGQVWSKPPWERRQSKQKRPTSQSSSSSSGGFRKKVDERFFWNDYADSRDEFWGDEDSSDDERSNRNMKSRIWEEDVLESKNRRRRYIDEYELFDQDVYIHGEDNCSDYKRKKYSIDDFEFLDLDPSEFHHSAKPPKQKASPIKSKY